MRSRPCRVHLGPNCSPPNPHFPLLAPRHLSARPCRRIRTPDHGYSQFNGLTYTSSSNGCALGPDTGTTPHPSPHRAVVGEITRDALRERARERSARGALPRSPRRARALRRRHGRVPNQTAWFPSLDRWALLPPSICGARGSACAPAGVGGGREAAYIPPGDGRSPPFSTSLPTDGRGCLEVRSLSSPCVESPSDARRARSLERAQVDSIVRIMLGAIAMSASPRFRLACLGT